MPFELHELRLRTFLVRAEAENVRDAAAAARLRAERVRAATRRLLDEHRSRPRRPRQALSDRGPPANSDRSAPAAREMPHPSFTRVPE